MISYRDGLPIDEDDSFDRSADQVPIDIRLDEKMRDVEESERVRIAFSNKEYGNPLYMQKSHPGQEPDFVIQTCLFVLLAFALVVGLIFLHMKIYKKRRQQIKGAETNEKDFEQRTIDRRRYDEEYNAPRAPTAEIEEDEDIIAPTFKLVQPKPSTSTSHHPGASTDV